MRALAPRRAKTSGRPDLRRVARAAAEMRETGLVRSHMVRSSVVYYFHS